MFSTIAAWRVELPSETPTFYSQAVADYYINHHGEDPPYLPVMTYHLLQAEARYVFCFTSHRSEYV